MTSLRTVDLCFSVTYASICSLNRHVSLLDDHANSKWLGRIIMCPAYRHTLMRIQGIP
jgi:hypothetical protein